MASEVLLAFRFLSSVQEQLFNGVEFTVLHKTKSSVSVFFPKLKNVLLLHITFIPFHALCILWTSRKELFNPLTLLKCFIDQWSLGRRGRCKAWAVRRTSRRQHRETCWKASCGASRYDRESLRLQECYSINKVTWFCLAVWISSLVCNLFCQKEKPPDFGEKCWCLQTAALEVDAVSVIAKYGLK